MIILAGYTRSVFQDFESFLRTEVDLIEDDIKWVLDEYNSNFITYEWQSGVYSFKDISEALYNILESEYPGSLNASDIRFHDITRKTELVVIPGIRAIGFNERSFFSSNLGFTPGWDF